MICAIWLSFEGTALLPLFRVSCLCPAKASTSPLCVPMRDTSRSQLHISSFLIMQAPCVAEEWDSFHPVWSRLIGSGAPEELRAADVASPSVGVELFGGLVGAREEGKELAGSYFDAGAGAPVNRNGLSPNFDGREFCAACWEPEGTFVMLTISKGARGGEVLARACAPLTALRAGYRVLPLRSSNGSRLQEGCAVLCHISTEPIGTISNAKQTELQSVTVALRDAGLD